MSKPLSVATSVCGIESLDELYRRYHAPVRAYLARLSGSPDVADELAQETFLRAWGALLGFRGECSVATWLFRIARNTYLNSLRQPSPSRIDTDTLLALPDETQYGDPVGRYAASEQRDLITWALAQLPEKQRSIVLLRDAEGLSYAEIADVLDISLAAVKVNLFRARAGFRQAYLTLSAGDEPNEGATL
jgi:RNA polymerase sigma-70 factor, ECF subfamily